MALKAVLTQLQQAVRVIDKQESLKGVLALAAQTYKHRNPTAAVQALSILRDVDAADVKLNTALEALRIANHVLTLAEYSPIASGDVPSSMNEPAAVNDDHQATEELLPCKNSSLEPLVFSNLDHVEATKSFFLLSNPFFEGLNEQTVVYCRTVGCDKNNTISGYVVNKPAWTLLRHSPMYHVLRQHMQSFAAGDAAQLAIVRGQKLRQQQLEQIAWYGGPHLHLSVMQRQEQLRPQPSPLQITNIPLATGEVRSLQRRSRWTARRLASKVIYGRHTWIPKQLLEECAQGVWLPFIGSDMDAADIVLETTENGKQCSSPRGQYMSLLHHLWPSLYAAYQLPKSVHRNIQESLYSKWCLSGDSNHVPSIYLFAYPPSVSRSDLTAND